jgi:hypothetical protein
VFATISPIFSLLGEMMKFKSNRKTYVQSGGLKSKKGMKGLRSVKVKAYAEVRPPEAEV